MTVTTGRSVKKARLATFLTFLLCGITVASWAPMVPIVKQRLAINEAELGIILLAMGAGAILAMPFMGPLIQKTGSRKIILVNCIIMALVLPALTIVATPWGLGVSLFIFGGALGSVDVAMNSQAVVVQDTIKKPVMSSFHGMFSVGGLIGSLGIGLLMMLHLTVTASACVISGILILVILTQFRNFLDHPPNKETSTFVFRMPGRNVIMLGVFCFIVFLAEGALLDWSALFLRVNRNFSITMAGAGYAVFSVAMAVMRFTGDGLVYRFGSGKIVFWGASIAAAGMLITVVFPWPVAALAGFVMIGIGSANIVPVIFSATGKADKTSPAKALAAVSTMGYSGQLAGPALIGFIAQLTSLPLALGLLAPLLIFVALAFKEKAVSPPGD